MFHSRWRGREWGLCPPDQVANMRDALVDLTPVSEARANATRAGWEPWLPNQTVPLIWERGIVDEPCYDI